jgi:hypothetical protein
MNKSMTLRDQFALQALPSCILWLREHQRDRLLLDGEPDHAQPVLPCQWDEEDEDPIEVAEAAYLFADAMIKVRSRK